MFSINQIVLSLKFHCLKKIVCYEADFYHVTDHSQSQQTDIVFWVDPGKFSVGMLNIGCKKPDFNMLISLKYLAQSVIQ